MVLSFLMVAFKATQINRVVISHADIKKLINRRNIDPLAISMNLNTHALEKRLGLDWTPAVLTFTACPLYPCQYYIH